MRIAVPDLVSNSYFPAVAAVELGFFKDHGLDLELDMVFPIGTAMEALRDGDVDFVAGPCPRHPVGLSRLAGREAAGCLVPAHLLGAGCKFQPGTSNRETSQPSGVSASERPQDPTPRSAACWPRQASIRSATA